MKFKKLIRRSKYILIIFGILAASFALTSHDEDDFEMVKNLDIYYTTMRELNLFYVDKLQPGELIKTSIDKMLASLDPYTVYIPESAIEDYRFMTTGEYGGIGASIRPYGEHVVIVNPYPDSPAEKAGLKTGDIILEIDGKSIKGKSMDNISNILKGESMSDLSLLIHRPGTADPIKKTITRQKITISSIPYQGMLTDKIGYISLSSFTQNAGQDVKKALLELKNENQAKSIILDLRDNPGGLLIEAVDIVNLFVPKGQEVVSMRGKVKQWNNIFHARYDEIDTDIPVIVLINRRSASASEIVSGALQDLDRAVIIGQRSFGKGLVQTTRDLSYNSKLKVTTAKYYIPSGRCIQALDYSNRNPDGSVGKIPDSLITEFKTKNGRKVYDGGGIIPDIKITGKQLSKVSVALIQKDVIFDYATQYMLKHDSIAAPKEFELDSNEYEKFMAFALEREFNYETESEKQLKQLIKTTKQEKYFHKAKDELEHLKNRIVHNQEADLKHFREEIEELIRQEIISRYYYQKGRIEASLVNFDPEVKKAMEILSDPELKTYRSVLNGGYSDEDENTEDNDNE